MQNKMIILVAPSGAGKSTILRRILKDKGDQLGVTVTYTTRSMRAGESEGSPYHFVDQQKFETLIQESFFVEWAKVHNHYYGTPEHQILDLWQVGKQVVMDVDVQGAKTFKAKYPQALTVFILPPSLEELRRRIIDRDGGEPSDLELRLSNARKEMDQVEDFDVQLVNEDIDQAYQQFEKIVEEYLDNH